MSRRRTEGIPIQIGLRAIELARRVDDPNVEVAASYATARTLASRREQHRGNMLLNLQGIKRLAEMGV